MRCVRRVLKLGVYVVEQAPVAFAPSVDALLHVAHDEVCSAVLTTKTLEQQDLEVGPLNGTCVLKLVNHDVVDLRAYLLIDERRVVLSDEPVEHILCVAQQEAVVLNVVFAHGLRYASEQTQLVHVCQHLLRGLIVVPLASARALGLFKQGRELVVSEGFQQRAVWPFKGCLGEPCVGVGESLTVGCEQLARLLVVEGRGVVVAALQLYKERGGSTALARKVVYGEARVVDGGKKLVCHILHALFSILCQGAQGGGVTLKKRCFADGRFQRVAMFLVEVFEDVASKIFDVSYDVPVFVVVYRVRDILHDPHQQLVRGAQVLDHPVHGLLLYLRVAQLYAHVGREVKLAREVAKHNLEERVDGHHAKMVVMVYEERERLSGSLCHDGGCEAEILAYLRGVVGRVGKLLPHAVELCQDTTLHLVCGLVCEGHGENVAVAHRVVDEHFNIFYGEREGLAASCARFINCQHVV